MGEIAATDRKGGDGRLLAAIDLADRLPELRIAAHRIAATLVAGWHGRGRGGAGEDFWQFRAFRPGEPARLVDWRRSGRDHRLYVRERELENAHTIWLFVDLSASMHFASSKGIETKAARAVLLALALAELLLRAGERVGLVGHARPFSGRGALEALGRQLFEKRAGDTVELPGVGRFNEVVLLTDALDAGDDATGRLIHRIAGAGARAHLIQILDPAEESFPYRGRVEFCDPETGRRLVAGPAESLGEAYRAELHRLKARLAGLIQRQGGSGLVHHTDEAPTAPLLALAAHLGEKALERVPFRLKQSERQGLTQSIDSEHFLFDQTIPPKREML